MCGACRSVAFSLHPGCQGYFLRFYSASTTGSMATMQASSLQPCSGGVASAFGCSVLCRRGVSAMRLSRPGAIARPGAAMVHHVNRPVRQTGKVKILSVHGRSVLSAGNDSPRRAVVTAATDDGSPASAAAASLEFDIHADLSYGEGLVVVGARGTKHLTLPAPPFLLSTTKHFSSAPNVESTWKGGSSHLIPQRNDSLDCPHVDCILFMGRSND